MTLPFLSNKYGVGSRSLLVFLLWNQVITSSYHFINAFPIYQPIHHHNYKNINNDHVIINKSPTKISTSKQHNNQLYMGIMENFISGQDAGTREEDNSKYLDTLKQRVNNINELENTIEKLDDDELQLKTKDFQKRIQINKESPNGLLLEEAFAVVREASWRVLELRHYDVQLIGGMILNDGRLAEMATGEGKTLVSTLPIYLNALRGKTSFIITVNDYLARRDMERMGQIYTFLGLSVGLIQSYMTPEQRQIQYSKDIVYVTNAELGFDYLRDHLALSYNQTVLLSSINDMKNNNNNNNEMKNGFLNDCFCVVDEADSIFIDEARTPLIISQQVPAPANKYNVATQLANALKDTVHYKVDLKNKNIIMTDIGYQDSERALSIDSIFSLDNTGEAWAPFIMNAIKAKELFTKDIEYTVLKEHNEPIGIGIIDSFTGRVLDGRRWSDGLHQSIEAMENITISSQSKVIAKITYQALFRQLFGKNRLSGMTGTAMADAKELETIYGLKVTPVPTALPIARRDYPDVAFKTRNGANEALIQEVMKVGGGNYDNGRPCLIGTTSIAQSEILVKALKEKGIIAELLNASPQNAVRESEIIAQAGRVGSVTVATNMAGRGTDILLGGCSRTMSRIKTRCVLIDNDIIKKDNINNGVIFPSLPPDDDYFPCDLDDDIEQQLIDAANAIKTAFPSLITEMELDEILTIAFDTTEADDDPEYIIKLRKAADSIKEAYNDVLIEEKDIVKTLGGLYVMGTNRHESSRIDSQLRGRAGRQGDPGSSRFFVSFEDDMFIIFGGSKLSNLLSTFRVADNMPIESKQISETLNKVQEQVEEKYRSIRNEIFRFDEVLNQQRNVIYNRRNKILSHSTSDDDTMMIQLFQSYNEDTIKEILIAQTNSNTGEVNYNKVLEKIHQFFPPSIQFVTMDDIIGKDMETIIAYITIVIDEVFQEKHKSSKSLARTSNYITLVTMDNAWSDHLQSLENLKESVILRSYQGREPISEYEKEAFVLFQGLEDTMRRNAVYSMWQSFMTQQQKTAAAINA